MKILLCTDGSPAAERAVRFGMLLARDSQEPIELLGVIEDRQDTDRIRAAMDTLGAELQMIGAVCEAKVGHGHAAEQILDEAEAWQANIIVIGQAGRRGLTRFIVGSTAMRVVQHAMCSVLLVKGERANVKKILVCTAGGEPGLRAVALAGWVAERARAAVTILHVMSQVPLSKDAYLPDLQANAEDLIARRTREGIHLQAALETLESHVVNRTAKVRHGFIIDEILAELHEGNYDLLVVGAHLARGLSRWLLDDVTARLLEETPLPVLVVRER